MVGPNDRARLRGWLTGGADAGLVSEAEASLPLGPSEPIARGKAGRVIDLFCGAGGFTRGMVAAGFEPVWANDFDAACIDTYSANFGYHAVHGNIDEVLTSGVRLPEAEVVVGGPPCQGFSLLNRERETDVRRQLWKAYGEVLRRVRPLAFVMENVPQLLSADEFLEFKSHAGELGYELVASILNSADYGVPQTRRRAIVIGSRVGTPTLPVPTHARDSKRTGLLRWRSVRDAIGDLPKPRGTEPNPRSKPPLDLHFGRTPTSVSLERYRSVPPGGNRFDLQRERPDITPGCWKRKKKGGTDLFGRLWWERPSVTIRTEFFKPEKGRYLHPVEDRPITHREAARLQTFPDTFKFCGTKIQIAKQIGNAVPCMFAAAIGNHMESMLQQSSVLDGKQGGAFRLR